MARIGEGAFRQYVDGQDRLTAREYTSERELIRLAVNDLDDKIQRTEGIREEFTNTVNEVETVKGEVIQTKQEVETRIGEFTQTIDQTTQELQQTKEHVSQVSTQLENKASKTEVQGVTAQLEEKIYYADTVSEMVSKIYREGDIVKTLGYYSVNDGGANLYKVIPTAEKRYDIPTSSVAFRPVANGVIHPKMFGTFNDGNRLDNMGLQRCYDYSYDMGIERIDGLNLLYIVGTENPYDKLIRGWSHTGAYVKAGRTLVNFRFKTANGSTNGTCPLTLWMEDNKKPIFLENIEIDGNKQNVTQLTTFDGKEDGGLHCVHIYHPDDDLSIKEFHPCGNIYFKNVKIKNHHSYGVRLDYLDCLFRLEDCEFDHSGIACQAHATKFEFIGGKVHTRKQRQGMVGNALHEEMEFAGNYTGNKKQSITIKGVKHTTESDMIGAPLFKIHYTPMGGVKWDLIKMQDCDFNGVGSAIDIFSDHGSIFVEIEELNMENNKNTFKSMLNLNGKINIKKMDLSKNVGRLSGVAEDGTGTGVHTLTNTQIGELTMRDYLFAGSSAVLAVWNSTVIDKLNIKNCVGKTLGTFGMFRNNTALVKMLNIDNCEFEASGQAVIWEAKFQRVNINNVKFNVSSADSLHNRVLYCHTNTRTEVIMNNVLIQGKGPKSASDTPFILFDRTVEDGYIYLNNVRYEYDKTPTAVSFVNQTKFIKVNCDPLFTTPV